MAKIIGNTTAIPNPQPDWNQTDETKADFIKNKPIGEGGGVNTFYTNTDPLLNDTGGILASNHPNGFEDVLINDLITELLYPYTPPVIKSFSLSPAVGAKEMNVSLTVNSATVNVIKKTKPLQSINLYKGSTLVATKTEGVTSGGMFTFSINESLDGSTDTSYKVTVVEAGDDGKTINSNNQTYDFVYPYFYGVIDKGTTVDSDTISGFTKSIKTKGNHSHTYSTTNQCPVIAYPKSYEALKSIVDSNNFTQTWTQSIVTVNNDKTIKGVEYYVYVGGVSTGNFTYKFNY